MTDDIIEKRPIYKDIIDQLSEEMAKIILEWDVDADWKDKNQIIKDCKDVLQFEWDIEPYKLAKNLENNHYYDSDFELVSKLENLIFIKHKLCQ